MEQPPPLTIFDHPLRGRLVVPAGITITNVGYTRWRSSSLIYIGRRCRLHPHAVRWSLDGSCVQCHPQQPTPLRPKDDGLTLEEVTQNGAADITHTWARNWAHKDRQPIGEDGPNSRMPVWHLVAEKYGAGGKALCGCRVALESVDPPHRAIPVRYNLPAPKPVCKRCARLAEEAGEL